MAFCGVQRVVAAGGIWSFGCGGSSEDHLYVHRHACANVCVHVCVKIRLS